MQKFEPKTNTPIRRRSCLTWQERSRSLHSRRHARRCAATSEFMACSTGCRCTRRRRRSSGGARRRGPYPRFIDATASCERITWIRRRPCPGRSAAVPAAISCRQREKPVVSMSTSNSSLRRSARTCSICPLRRPAREEGAREQRGSGRPLYGIQQHIAALKTARTRRKHAYKPTFVRWNIF